MARNTESLQEAVRRKLPSRRGSVVAAARASAAPGLEGVAEEGGGAEGDEEDDEGGEIFETDLSVSSPVAWQPLASSSMADLSA